MVTPTPTSATELVAKKDLRSSSTGASEERRGSDGAHGARCGAVCVRLCVSLL